MTLRKSKTHTKILYKKKKKQEIKNQVLHN